MPSQTTPATRDTPLVDITTLLSSTSSLALNQDNDVKMLFPRQSSTLDFLDSEASFDQNNFQNKLSGGCLSFSSGSRSNDLSSPTYKFNPREVYGYTKLSSRSMSVLKDGIYRDNVKSDNTLVGPPTGRVNIAQCFEYMLKKSNPEMPCLGTRQENGVIRFVNRQEFQEDFLHLAEGFRTEIDELFPIKIFDDIGLHPAPSVICDQSTIPNDVADLRIVGIATKNVYEFPLMEYVSQLLGLTMVPLYSTLGVEAMTAVFQETEMKTIILDLPSAQLLTETWSEIANTNCLPDNVILTHNQYSAEWKLNNGPDLIKKLHDLGRSVTYLRDYQAQTPIEDHHRYQWHPENVWTIAYTSGTTGRAKGAMLSQRCFMAVTFDVLSTYCRDEGLFNTGDYFPTYFSYLPLAHILERASLNTVLMTGFKICFHSGNLLTLIDEVRESGTTLLPSVPRVLERIHMKIMDIISTKGFVVRKLFNHAKKSKISHRQGTTEVCHSVWDPIIMDKIKALSVGPQLKTIICGGAPLATELKKDIEAFLGVSINNGYGLTETSGASFVQHSRDTNNYIGWIMKSAEAKLIDVPELDRYSKDGSGEIIMRGYGVFSGYFRQADKTREVLTPDGWFHTGDVATYCEKNGFAVVDRVKNCFKLAQGEYIAPERIENILKSCYQVDQAIVTGDSTKTYPIALLSLTESALGGKEAMTLISDSVYRSSIVEEVQARCKELGLKGFEIPKVFIFMSRALLPDDGFHTPTLKLKRTTMNKRCELLMNHAYQKNAHTGLDIDRFVNCQHPTTAELSNMLK